MLSRRCSAVNYNAIQCSTVQSIAIYCSTAQCNAAPSSTLHARQYRAVPAGPSTGAINLCKRAFMPQYSTAPAGSPSVHCNTASSTAPHLQAAPQYIAVHQAVQHRACRQPLSTLQYIKHYSTTPAGSPSVQCGTSSSTAPRLQAAPQYSAVLQRLTCRQHPAAGTPWASSTPPPAPLSTPPAGPRAR